MKTQTERKRIEIKNGDNLEKDISHEDILVIDGVEELVIRVTHDVLSTLRREGEGIIESVYNRHKPYGSKDFLIRRRDYGEDTHYDKLLEDAGK